MSRYIGFGSSSVSERDRLHTSLHRASRFNILWSIYRVRRSSCSNDSRSTRSITKGEEGIPREQSKTTDILEGTVASDGRKLGADEPGHSGEKEQARCREDANRPGREKPFRPLTMSVIGYYARDDRGQGLSSPTSGGYQLVNRSGQCETNCRGTLWSRKRSNLGKKMVNAIVVSNHEAVLLKVQRLAAFHLEHVHLARGAAGFSMPTRYVAQGFHGESKPVPSKVWRDINC